MHLATVTALLAAGLVGAAAPAHALPAGLVEALRTRNPELRALAARAAEARTRVNPAGALPEPRLEVEVMDPMAFGGPRAAIRQMLPLAGQPALMARMAALDADMKDAAHADREQMLVAEAERLLAELAYVARAEGLTVTMRDHAAHMARVAEARYAVGAGTQPDVLRAHLARTRLLGTSAGYGARRRSAGAALDALAPGWQPPEPRLSAGLPLPPAANLARLARTHSPMLRMKRLAITHAETEVQLARAERLPDVELGMMAGRTMPGDMPFLGGMAMTTLPLWYQSRQAARVTAAAERLQAERAALAAAERDLDARLAAALAQVAAADRQLAIYRGGLLAQARQAFRVTLVAYQVGQTDFLMLLDALMALYDAEMAEAMAITERRQMAAMALALAGSATADAGRAP
jgi:outer membrane protein TolC